MANARILRETPLEDIYIQPAAGDDGGALGAALYVWHAVLGNADRHPLGNASWGSEFDDAAIAAALEQSPFKGQRMQDETSLVDATAGRLIDGKVVGWFQGRSEWGPRALGNRSILADPRRIEMKDTVNAVVKFREPFRPFAPSVIAEAAGRYFELDGVADSYPARFMLLVVPVREEMQSVIPAVSHEGTARVQVVHREANPRFHALLTRFGEATGHPVLLNTSFNVRGEPIVDSPQDALRTFDNSGIDTLVMGNYIVDKPQAYKPQEH